MPDLTKMSVEELLKMYAAPDFDTEEDLRNIDQAIIAELTRRMEVPKGHVVVDADTIRQAMEVIDDSLEERAPRHELGGLFCRLRNALAAKGVER